MVDERHEKLPWLTEGVLAYMSYIHVGMCSPKGYFFSSFVEK